MAPRLELIEVSKVYRAAHSKGTKTVLHPLSLTVEAGEALGIVGESGAGKSTLARIIVGWEQPSSGRVCFEGRWISQLKKRQRQALKKEIQMFWQDPYSFLNPYLSVERLIGEPLEVFNLLPREKRKARVRELARLVGLDERLLENPPGRLSGGQAQRAAIARALVLEPKLLVCDEILTGLDGPHQVHILQLLKDLKERLDLTLFFHQSRPCGRGLPLRPHRRLA